VTAYRYDRNARRFVGLGKGAVLNVALARPIIVIVVALTSSHKKSCECNQPPWFVSRDVFDLEMNSGERPRALVGISSSSFQPDCKGGPNFNGTPGTIKRFFCPLVRLTKNIESSY
jgi:hypothetical protein